MKTDKIFKFKIGEIVLMKTTSWRSKEFMILERNLHEKPGARYIQYLVRGLHSLKESDVVYEMELVMIKKKSISMRAIKKKAKKK